MSRPGRAAAAGLIALAAIFAVGALSFRPSPATPQQAADPAPLSVAQECQQALGYPARTAADRTWLRQCVHALASPSPSGSPTPTPPASPTPTPTPTTTTPAPTTPPATTPPPTTVPPTPTPTPTGPAGWPTPGDTAAGSTGWRHTGVTLTVHTELMRITTPGAIVDAVEARGGIEVQADNVTIKRSWVQGAGTGPGAGIWIDDGRDGTVIEDVEVSSHPGYDPTNEAAIVDRAITAGSGKNTSGVRMMRVYAHDMIRGLQFSCGTVIEDSYVDGEVNPSGDHMSAIGGDTCAMFTLTVRHNHIGLSPNEENSAALLYYPPQVGAYGPQHAAISIVDNEIRGGTYCMWLSSDPQLSGTLVVTGNRFRTDYWPSCGRYGALFSDHLPSEGGMAITWADNLLGGLIVAAPHG
jgi:hypothetical protein